MSAQDLAPKTKFDKQVPYNLIGEIAEAVKASEAKCPVFPAPTYMQIERIYDAVDKLEAAGFENNHSPSGEDDVHLWPYVLNVIAEAVRMMKTLPKP